MGAAALQQALPATVEGVTQKADAKAEPARRCRDGDWS
jgi:hypothetical protein